MYKHEQVVLLVAAAVSVCHVTHCVELSACMLQFQLQKAISCEGVKQLIGFWGVVQSCNIQSDLLPKSAVLCNDDDDE